MTDEDAPAGQELVVFPNQAPMLIPKTDQGLGQLGQAAYLQSTGLAEAVDRAPDAAYGEIVDIHVPPKPAEVTVGHVAGVAEPAKGERPDHGIGAQAEERRAAHSTNWASLSGSGGGGKGKISGI